MAERTDVLAFDDRADTYESVRHLVGLPLVRSTKLVGIAE